MNGWQRLGIVLSALWFLSVFGYTVYERSLLPVRFFAEETEDPGYSWDFARPLFFDLDRETAGDVSAQVQRWHQAKTDEERNKVQADLNKAMRPVFKTSLKDFFWLCLLAPIVGLWVLTYAFLFISRWVISGFTRTNK